MTAGRILLAGGGGAEDSLLLDRQFAEWVGPKGKVLYWPFARQDLKSFESCRSWISTTFARLNLHNIHMWTGLKGHQAHELEDFDAVYIGGGNTYWLLSQMVKYGFDHHLKAYIAHGGILYGGSAGAVVLGRDIHTVRHMDHNITRLTDTRGLNLALDCSVWVHYKPVDDKRIKEYMQNLGTPVIAIPERSGVIISANGIEAAGYEPAFYFDTTIKYEI